MQMESKSVVVEITGREK